MLNFADDSTISATENTIEKLISTLDQDSQAAVDWFKINEMIVNPDKFQAIVVRDGSKAAATSKMERFVKIVNDFQPLTITTKRPILNVAAVLDPPLVVKKNCRMKDSYNDSTSDYNQLLNKSSKASMEVKRLRNLVLEIFKTMNHLNPEYMKDIFYKTTNLTLRPFNIKSKSK